MIAIPIDKATMSTRSSKLFGNVAAFALYDRTEQAFHFVPNNGKGDGIATAKALKELNVKTVTYSYMGNGPFGALEKEGIDIYYIGKEPLALGTIIEGIDTNNFVKVVPENAETYLDPGTATGSCQCGCSHA